MRASFTSGSSVPPQQKRYTTLSLSQSLLQKPNSLSLGFAASAMADASKHHLPLGGTLISSELKSFFPAVHTRRRIKLFAYGFMVAFVTCTVFLAFNPNGNSSPWYNRIFSSPSSFFSFFFPQDHTTISRSFNADSNEAVPAAKSNLNSSFYAPNKNRSVTRSSNATSPSSAVGRSSEKIPANSTRAERISERKGARVSMLKWNGNGRNGTKEEEVDKCNVFEGRWVRDDSYPLYREGSCPHVDEPFNCFLNGRPDRHYQNLRWQPNGCNIPR